MENEDRGEYAISTSTIDVVRLIYVACMGVSYKVYPRKRNQLFMSTFIESDFVTTLEEKNVKKKRNNADGSSSPSESTKRSKLIEACYDDMPNTANVDRKAYLLMGIERSKRT